VDFGVAGREKFAVIHSGVDFAPAAPEGPGREEMRRELGIPPGALVVGTLGRLTAVKGQGDLVEAFARVRSQVQNAWLLLVGDGEERANLEARARKLGVEGCTVLAGWRQEVFALLAAMDIFALPSRNEGMGKALVEAMFAGLPCVATRVGGIPELVRHGQEGLLVEPGCAEQLAEVLVELALDAEKRACMGQAGRARAPAYGVEQMLEKLEALYEELLLQKGVKCSPG
jgi:glycosyltransferase involved in cell wall biosynthesis